MSNHVDLMLTANGIQRRHVHGTQRGEGSSLTVTWKSACMHECSEIVFYFRSPQIADFANSYLGSSKSTATKDAPKTLAQVLIPA